MHKKVKMIAIMIIIMVLTPILVAIGVTLQIPCLERVPISNDWIGFWASYFGILVSIGMPIYLFWQQRKEDRRQSVMTILDAYQNNGLRQNQGNPSCTIDYVWKNGRFYIYVLDDEKHIGLKKEVLGGNYFSTQLIIRNIGIGPTIDLNVYMDNGKKEPNESISIAPGEFALYKIYIPKVKLLEDKNSAHKLLFEFKDIYQNQYRQSITFGTSFSEGKGVCLTKFNPISKIERI